jgi:hypothetical protein
MIEDGDCDGCVEKIVAKRVDRITKENDRLRELLRRAIALPWEGPYDEKQQLLHEIDAILEVK